MPSIYDQDIIDRARNWKQRVYSLYEQIRSWLKNTDFNLEESEPVNFPGVKERVYGLEKPFEIPTADIYKQGKVIASLKPKGLWAIGSNGRIDLLNRSNPVILIDQAVNQDEPYWEIVYGEHRKIRQPLSKNVFLDVLQSL